MRLAPPGELSSAQRAIADGFGGIDRLPVPVEIWIRSPDLCGPVEALGDYCRSGTALPLPYRELAILCAAAHVGSRFSWDAHYDKGLGAGLSPELLDLVRKRQPSPSTETADDLVHAFLGQALSDAPVDDGTYGALVELIGELGLVDLVGCLGSGLVQAIALKVFEAESWQQAGEA